MVPVVVLVIVLVVVGVVARFWLSSKEISTFWTNGRAVSNQEPAPTSCSMRPLVSCEGVRPRAKKGTGGRWGGRGFWEGGRGFLRGWAGVGGSVGFGVNRWSAVFVVVTLSPRLPGYTCTARRFN